MNKITELKSSLYTDISGRWVHASDINSLVAAIVEAISADLALSATCFDGEVGSGIKIASRLVKEWHGRAK
jgi:hypothetical protein